MSIERELDPRRRPGLAGNRDVAQARAALEALFAPKPAPPAPAPPAPPPSARSLAKIARATPAARDPREERAVLRVLSAEGPRAVARAVAALERDGLTLPEDHDTSLRMLEHPDDARVRRAIAVLARVVDERPPPRRAVLDARLRRVEELADDQETRDAASALRRKLARGQA